MSFGMLEGETKQTKAYAQKSESKLYSATRTENGFSLLQKGVLFFSVTLLLTMLLAAIALHELNNSSMGVLATADTIAVSKVPDGNNHPDQRYLLLAPFVILFITLVIGLLFFIRHIAVPLDNISRATQRMANGLLDQPIHIAENNELGRIGEFINELAINMQEVLLYIWNHNQENRELIDRLEKKICAYENRDGLLPRNDEEIIAQMIQGNTDVKSMILLYDFYDLKLEKEKMLINPQAK